MTPDERVVEFLQDADNEGFDRVAILEAMAKIVTEIWVQSETEH